MTVPAQNGILGFGMQSAKTVIATKYFRHRASDINYGPIQDTRTFPLEVGGVFTPTGAYKAGVFMGGGATLQPRMEGDFGWILKGLMGQDVPTAASGDLVAAHAAIDSSALATTSTGWTQPVSPRNLAIYSSGSLTGTCTFTIIGTDDNDAVITEAGLTCTTTTLIGAPTITALKYKTITSLQVTGASTGSTPTITVATYKKVIHNFQFNTDASVLPWMTVNKLVPGTTPLWEIGQDNKVVSVRFNFPQNGIVSARVDWLGRIPDWTTPVRTPTWNGAFEDYPSVPVTCDINGGILLPNTYYTSTEIPMTNLVLTMANNLTSPQQEMIIGSPYPDDFVPLSRAATIQATLKWADPQLYLDIMTGSITGATWGSAPFTSNFDATITASGTIPGSSGVQYAVEIKAASVFWNVSGPPTLAGGDIIMLPLIGTVLEPAVGSKYLEIIITNETASYA